MFDVSRKHEWFQKDLPAYLFPSPVEQDSSVIDTDAVNEVCEVTTLPSCTQVVNFKACLLENLKIKLYLFQFRLGLLCFC